MTSWEEARQAYWYDDKGRDDTLAFQRHFKHHAPNLLDAWYEVVRWKSPRSKGRTVNHIRSTGITARELLRLCEEYIDNPTIHTFRRFRVNIAKTDVVATAATFPAFLQPGLFPMVDTQTAKWVLQNPWTRIAAPNLNKGEVLHESHWQYVCDWVRWCRQAAQQLGAHWTPRDVEMAVFTAQRSDLDLPPLPTR